jgi:hypothetical protein
VQWDDHHGVSAQEIDQSANSKAVRATDAIQKGLGLGQGSAAGSGNSSQICCKVQTGKKIFVRAGHAGLFKKRSFGGPGKRVCLFVETILGKVVAGQTRGITLLLITKLVKKSFILSGFFFYRIVFESIKVCNLVGES